MNYDNMFEFEKTDCGYSLKKYLLRDNSSVTEIDIPSKYLGKPVADELIEFSMELNKVEITAWLLDYKNKNIGFSGNNYEL